MDYTDLHIAKTKINLKSSNHCLSFVTTLWKGEVIMCAFNNIQHNIINIFCKQTFDSEELALLENIINEFIFGEQ